MDPRLFDAVVLGDLRNLEDILNLPERQADQEAKIRLMRGVTSEGDGVLHLAARYGHHQVVNYVRRRADLGPAVIDLAARSSNGDTAFHCAATPEMVELLIRLIRVETFASPRAAELGRGTTAGRRACTRRCATRAGRRRGGAAPEGCCRRR
jgi:ankyrin repeat protein